MIQFGFICWAPGGTRSTIYFQLYSPMQRNLTTFKFEHGVRTSDDSESKTDLIAYIYINLTQRTC